MKTEKQIAEDIADLRNKLDEAERDLAARQQMDPEKRLALDLHELMCSHYSGGCEWGATNRGWDGDYEMKLYLRRAKALLEVTTHEEAIRIIELSKS